jgi:hypothetical protein
VSCDKIDEPLLLGDSGAAALKVRRRRELVNSTHESEKEVTSIILVCGLLV